MSTPGKLKKYLDKPLNFSGKLSKQPIIIADSKGVYLKRQASDIFQPFCHIEFECRKGARYAEYYQWLTKNLYRKVNQFGNIVLYIFLGTCDLTKLNVSIDKNSRRQKRYIELRHNDDKSAVSYLIEQINKFCLFVSNFPSVSIVFLEIPPYCIREWNRLQGHPDPASFADQDTKLYERISIINEYIQGVNGLSHVESPHFNLYLKRGRKEKGSSHRKYSLFFANYKDGIHSKPLLARCWMKEILIQIFRDCA